MSFFELKLNFCADRKRSRSEPSRVEPSRAENSRTHHYWIVHPCAYRARSKVRIIKPIRFDVSYFFSKKGSQSFFVQLYWHIEEESSIYFHYFVRKSSVLWQNIMPMESNACFLFEILLFKQVIFLSNIVCTIGLMYKRTLALESLIQINNNPDPSRVWKMPPNFLMQTHFLNYNFD